MTPKEFATCLDLARRIGDAPLACRDFETLTEVFALSPEKKATGVLKKLRELPTGAGQVEQDVVGWIARVEALSAASGAKVFASLLRDLSDIIQTRGHGSLEAFTRAAAELSSKPKPSSKSAKASAPLRPELVRAFLKRLEESLGDEGFSTPFQQLESDPSISAAEVIEIAKVFTTKKTTSRPKALHAIWQRHHNLMVFRNKSESRDGRSAA